MKNRLSILIMLPILFLVTACTKSTVTPNQTILTTIGGNKWSSGDGGKTYSVLINTPEIDSYMNNYGAVLLYASFNGKATYEQIPEVYNGVAYSFSHSVGQVEIDIQPSNGTGTISPPGTIDVKIVLIPSER